MHKRNLIANYLGQGWTVFIGLIFVPIYIKYLGIESYGLIGLFGVLQAWLGLLDMGMTPTLSREMARFTSGTYTSNKIRDLLRSIEVVAITVAILISIGIGLGAEWLAISWLRVETLPIHIVEQAFIIMGMVTALRFIESVYRSSVIGLQQHVLLNILSAGMSTFRAIGAAVIVIWVSPTIQAFFLWQGLISLATLIVLSRMTYISLPKDLERGKFSVDAIKGVWKFASGVLIITFLALLLTTVDKIILAKILTLTEYGYFNLASVVASVLLALVGPIATTFFPRFCQLIAEKNDIELARAYHQGSQIVSVIVGSAAIVIFLNSEVILELWTQDSMLAKKTAPLVSLLVLGSLFNAFMWMPYQCQLAYGWTSLGIGINLFAVSLMVPTIFLATEQYGSFGAASAWVSLNAAYCLIGTHFMHHRILKNEKWKWYWSDIMIPLIPAVTTALLIKWFAPIPTDTFEKLILLTCSSTLTLIVAGYASKEFRGLFYAYLNHR